MKTNKQLGKSLTHSDFKWSKVAAATALCLFTGMNSANANPNAPTVVAGSVEFDSVGAQLNITNTPGAIIDWQGFSIDAGELTRFMQESASSAVLNRVTGDDISRILGDLQSNGQVFLINPNGLVVGEGAVIDVAGFVGSTLDISNDDFSNANYAFSGTGGAIENHGHIHVNGDGNIALIAESVENSGILQTDNGDIVLAAGRAVSLSFEGLPNLSFEVAAPDNAVLNLGQIIAGGGNASLVGSRIANSGDIELVESNDGRIFIQAIDDAIIEGTLTTTGADIHIEAGQVELRGATLDSSSNGSAGDISLLGDNVGLFSGSSLKANGDTNGGTILIGGEQQGRGDTRTSEFVYVAKDATVSADGRTTGDGGKVILFAENTARIRGKVTARGGDVAGDGGFIETSGLIGLEVNVAPDAGATNGLAGEWLIDPNDIVINSDEGESNFDQSTEGSDEVFTANASGAAISSGTINSALMTSNVTIDTGSTGSEAGDITINSAIYSYSGSSLTFNAANSIFINASIELNPYGGEGGNGGSSVVSPSAEGTLLQFNSNLAGNGGSTYLQEGVSYLVADTVEFLGGGLKLADTYGYIQASQLNVEGDLSLSSSGLRVNGDASIDKLVITPSETSSGGFIASGGGDVVLGYLEVKPGFSTDQMDDGVILSAGSITLLNGGKIDLTVEGEYFEEQPVLANFTIEGNFINQGNLTISGNGFMDIGMEEFGQLRNENRLVLEGDLNIFTGSAIINNGTLIAKNLSGNQESFILIDGGIENNSVLRINQNTILGTTSLQMNEAELALSEGVLDLFDPFNPIGLTIGDGSSITGTGLIVAELGVTVEDGGIIAPGNSPGEILVDGDLELNDGAILNMELAGPNPADYDHIGVLGNLVVGGGGAGTPGVVVNVINLDNYQPNANTNHNIITVGGSVSQSGTPFNSSATGFDSLNLAFNGGNLSAKVSVDVVAPPPPPAEEAPVEETPVTPEPTPPAVEEPPVEEPQASPEDIINDVLVIGDPEPASVMPEDDEEQDRGPVSYENECR